MEKTNLRDNNSEKISLADVQESILTLLQNNKEKLKNILPEGKTNKGLNYKALEVFFRQNFVDNQENLKTLLAVKNILDNILQPSQTETNQQLDLLINNLQIFLIALTNATSTEIN